MPDGANDFFRNGFVRVDAERQTYRVARRAFVDDEVFKAEREKIFDKCWLYLGHDSELPKPGDFVTRMVGGRSLIFARDAGGKLHALLNSCPHRGARVCREKSGNSKFFPCFYHGWVFGLDGQLKELPGADSYPPDFQSRPEYSLQPAPRYDSFRGFHFVCFDRDAVSLSDYLGGAKEYLELIADQSEAGMTIVGGTQEYSMRANWKLLAENSIDGYHAVTNHASYMDYIKDAVGGLVQVNIGGTSRDLGNGHAVIEYRGPWGRPTAQWVPAWGEESKRRIEHIYADLVRRCGQERADRMAIYNRNMVIFPNLVVNDAMGLTVRAFTPLAPDLMSVNAWALAPIDENLAERDRRMVNFIEFLGPGGFATPDDIEALEQCQQGFANYREVGWNDISRGMGRNVPNQDDEAQMRGFWNEWNRRMCGDAS